LDGATVERRDLVLEEASKVDAEWFGLARDPEPGSTWVEASGLALWNLSSGDRLAQFPNPQDVSIVGKRWIVACAGSPSDGATERYLVHELKTGRVASSFEVPPEAFVLGATDAAMFFATGTTLLAVRLGGGAPQAVGGAAPPVGREQPELRARRGPLVRHGGRGRRLPLGLAYRTFG
jgi:hypothetical protein